MWSELPSPVVIGHRGDKANAPENTLGAFKLASLKGADAVEFDVKLTADGQVIVLHDQTVDRTTDGIGNVAKLPFSVLRELNANKQFPDKFPGEKIPSLDEVFETVGDRLYMNVELTNYATPSDDLVPRVVEIVKKHRMEKKVLFSSFFPRNLHSAMKLLPEVPCALLTFFGMVGWWGRTFGWRKDYYALHPYLTDTYVGLVERVHAAGKRLQVWTVNIENDVKRMIGLGVDGIITDDPALVLRVLGRK